MCILLRFTVWELNVPACLQIISYLLLKYIEQGSFIPSPSELNPKPVRCHQAGRAVLV